MSLKEELEALQKQKREVEAKITAIYDASLNAPASEKVCDDSLASLLAEPVEGFIQYPITVSGIAQKQNDVIDYSKKTGRYVAVRPCDEHLKGKTFLGIYLGEIALGAGAFYYKETGVLEVKHWMHNPAIWVPDLTRIIFGCGSWWGLLKKPEDLKQISDADINDIWYVKSLKSLETTDSV